MIPYIPAPLVYMLIPVLSGKTIWKYLRQHIFYDWWLSGDLKNSIAGFFFIASI